VIRLKWAVLLVAISGTLWSMYIYLPKPLVNHGQEQIEDLGYVLPGQRLERCFEWSNQSRNPQELESVRVSCSCMSLKQITELVSQGAIGSACVSLESPETSGNYKYSVWLQYSNACARQLSVLCRVRDPVDAWPKKVTFAHVPGRVAPQVQVVELSSIAVDRVREPPILISQPSWLEVTEPVKLSVESTEAWTVTLRIKNAADISDSTVGSLVVGFGKERVSVQCQVDVLPELVVKPSRLHYGKCKIGETTSRKFHVRYNAGWDSNASIHSQLFLDSLGDQFPLVYKIVETGDKTAEVSIDYTPQEIGAFDFDVAVKGPTGCFSIVNLSGFAHEK
jgi:hypothetical protein